MTQTEKDYNAICLQEAVRFTGYFYLHPSRTHSLMNPAGWHLLMNQSTCDMNSSFSNPIQVNRTMFQYTKNTRPTTGRQKTKKMNSTHLGDDDIE